MRQKHRDDSTFELLYLRYREELLRFAHRYFENGVDCEDAVEDALLNIRDHMDMVHAIDSPETRALCLTVLKNVCLNMLKKGRREEPTDFSDEAAGRRLEEDRLAKAWEDGGRDYEALYGAMERLDTEVTEMLWLKYRYQYSSRQIGKLYGKSPGTVDQILSRARRKLKDIMTGEAEHEK